MRDDYFNDLITHGVPYDPRAYTALSHSGLSPDAYFMPWYRLPQGSRKGVKVTCMHTLEEFGDEYTGKDSLRNFKDRFLPAVKDALNVYPEAKVEIVTGGLMLKQSRPAISKL